MYRIYVLLFGCHCTTVFFTYASTIHVKVYTCEASFRVCSSTVPLLNLEHRNFILIHAKFSWPWLLYAHCVLVNVLLFFATLGEREEEATCNADEGCWGSQESRGSPPAHKCIQKHTHRPLHKKSLSHYSLVGFPLSFLFVHFSLHSFFLHTYQVKRFWPLSIFSFECTAALGWILILLSKVK